MGRTPPCGGLLEAALPCGPARFEFQLQSYQVGGLGQVIDSLCACFLSFKVGVAIYFTGYHND